MILFMINNYFIYPNLISFGLNMICNIMNHIYKVGIETHTSSPHCTDDWHMWLPSDHKPFSPLPSPPPAPFYRRILVTFASWKQVVSMSQKTTRVSIQSIRRTSIEFISEARSRGGTGERKSSKKISSPRKSTVAPKTPKQVWVEGAIKKTLSERQTGSILAAMNGDWYV